MMYVLQDSMLPMMLSLWVAASALTGTYTQINTTAHLLLLFSQCKIRARRGRRGASGGPQFFKITYVLHRRCCQYSPPRARWGFQQRTRRWTIYSVDTCRVAACAMWKDVALSQLVALSAQLATVHHGCHTHGSARVTDNQNTVWGGQSMANTPRKEADLDNACAA